MKITGLRLPLPILVIVVILSAGFFLVMVKSRPSTSIQYEEKNIEKTTHLNNKATDNNSTIPDTISVVEISGILNLIYGDPQDGSKPRYSYSLTDNQGLTVNLIYTDDTEYIGGSNLAYFDRKMVKVTGRYIKQNNTFELSSVEPL